MHKVKSGTMNMRLSPSPLRQMIPMPFTPQCLIITLFDPNLFTYYYIPPSKRGSWHIVQRSSYGAQYDILAPFRHVIEAPISVDLDLLQSNVTRPWEEGRKYLGCGMGRRAASSSLRQTWQVRMIISSVIQHPRLALV
jgi:hypothetical protein